MSNGLEEEEEYRYGSGTAIPRQQLVGPVNLPQPLFSRADSINHHSYMLRHNLSINDVFMKSFSFTDLAKYYAPVTHSSLPENFNRSNQLKHVQSSLSVIGDRFVPRRRGVNIDAFRYHSQHNENDEDQECLDVFKGVENAVDHWRRKYMDQTFKLYDVFNGMQSERVLQFGMLSSIDLMSLNTREFNDECGWYCRPRKQPLMNMKGENSKRYRDHGAQVFRFAIPIKFKHLIDWSSKNVLASCLADQLCICDEDGENTKVYGVYGNVYLCCVKWSPEGTEIAISSVNGATSLYGEDFKQLRWSRKCACYKSGSETKCRVNCIEWVKKYSRIISGCDMGRLEVINSENGKLIASEDLKKEILAVSICPSETYLAVSKNDRFVKLFHYPSLVPILEIGFIASVKAIAWHPWQTSVLCVGGGPGDASLSLWNVKSQRLLDYRRVRFVGSVDWLSFNKRSGELVVHWYYIEGGKLHSKIAVLASLDRIVDAVPIQPEHRMINIVWNPDHTRLAMQHRNTLVIWNFFGAQQFKCTAQGKAQNKFRGKAQGKAQGKALDPEEAISRLRGSNNIFETSSSDGSRAGVSTASCGNAFGYYSIR